MLRRVLASVLAASLMIEPCLVHAGPIGEAPTRLPTGQSLPVGTGETTTTAPLDQTQPQALALPESVVTSGQPAAPPQTQGQVPLQESRVIQPAGEGAARIAPPAVEAAGVVVGAPVQPTGSGAATVAPPADHRVIGGGKTPDGEQRHGEIGGPPTATEVLGVKGKDKEEDGTVATTGEAAQPRAVKNPEGTYDGNTRLAKEDPAPAQTTEIRDAAGAASAAAPIRPQLDAARTEGPAPEAAVVPAAPPTAAGQADAAPTKAAETGESVLAAAMSRVVGAIRGAGQLVGLGAPRAPRKAGLRPGTTAESRTYFSLWIRVARMMAPGQHTTDFDPAVAAHLRSSLGALQEHVPADNAYHNFSRLLTELILDLNDPKKGPARVDVQARTRAILEALDQEKSAYQYVTGAAILMESYSKLGLGPALLTDGPYDLVQKALDKVATIPRRKSDKEDRIYGLYEQVTAYGSLFAAIGQLGLKRYLTRGEDYVSKALGQLETIGSPWNRGRGASVLFASLKLLGMQDRLFAHGRDHVEETLAYIDRAEEIDIWPTFPAVPLTHAYFTIEPYLTVLNTLSILGMPQYVARQRRRIEKAKVLMAQLTPAETLLIGEYYLMTLHNLGELERTIPDLDAYLEKFADIMNHLSAAPNWFPNGVAYPYAMETLWLFGREDLITQDMVRRMLDSLPGFVDKKDVANWSQPLSYILNTLGELGLMDAAFLPGAPFGGDSPMLWGIRRFTSSPDAGLEKSLPQFDHALITLALRMRGKDRGETDLYKGVEFLGDTPASPSARRKALLEELRRRDVRYLALDYDENFAPDGQPPSPEALQALEEALAAGIQVDFISNGKAERLAHDLKDMPAHLKERVLIAAEGGANVGRAGPDGEFQRIEERSLPIPASTIDAVHEAYVAALAEHGLSPGSPEVVKLDKKRTAVSLVLRHRDDALAGRIAASMERRLAALGLPRPAHITHNGRVIEVAFSTKLDYVVARAKEQGLRQDQVGVVGDSAFPSGGDWSMFQIAEALRVYSGQPRPDVPAEYLRTETSDPDGVTSFLRLAAQARREHHAPEGARAARRDAIERELDRRDVRLAIFDYDGNLAPGGHALSARAVRALQELVRAGVTVVVLSNGWAPRLARNLAALDADVREKLILAAEGGANVGRVGPRGEFLRVEQESVQVQAAHIEAVRAAFEGALAEQGLSAADGAVRLETRQTGAMLTLTHPDRELVGRIVASMERRLRGSVPRMPYVIETAYFAEVLFSTKLDFALKVMRERGLIPDDVVISGDTAFPGGGDWSMFQLEGALRLYSGTQRPGVPEAFLRTEVMGAEGVADFMEQLARHRRARPAPPARPRAQDTPEATPEARALVNGWPRVALGFAPGMLPTGFDPRVAKLLREQVRAAQELPPARAGGGTAPWQAFNRFSGLLTDFILDVEDPKGGVDAARLKSRTGELILALEAIEGPLLYANAATLLFEAFGKLGLGPSLLVTPERDLVGEALSRIERISPRENTSSGGEAKARARGDYNQLIAYSRLFLALGQLGLKDRLLERANERGNHIEASLALLDEIPSGFARGRYGSLHFTALKLLGFDGYLYKDGNRAGRDYVAELLDYVDDESHFEVDTTLAVWPKYRKAYPMLLLLNAIGVLGRTEYLHHGGRDRLKAARELMAQVKDKDGDEVAKLTMLHLFALSNLGVLQRELPDLDGFLRGWAKRTFELPLDTIPHEPLYVGRSIGYAIETLMLLGRRDLITPAALKRWRDSLSIRGLAEVSRNEPYNAAYMMTVLGELGPDYAVPMLGAPLAEFLEELGKRPKETEQYLQMLDHAFVNYALRMRAPSSPAARAVPEATAETMALANGWVRVSRGIALGMLPTEFDPVMAQHLQAATRLLDRQMPASDTYNRFSNLLTRFVLDVENPAARLGPGEIEARTEELVAALKAIDGPFLYVNAASLLFESFGKLGLGPELLVNARRDLVGEALEKVARVAPEENTASGGESKIQARGNYNQLISYSQLFMAIGHLGLKGRLFERAGDKGSYVDAALAIIDEIPSAFARGRYASLLFTALQGLGFGRYVFHNAAGKDYLAETLEYVDDERHFEVDTSLAGHPNYRRAYPKLLLLGSIGVLGRPEYLTYKKDRLHEAREIMASLKDEAGDDVSKNIMLYLFALSNLGVLSQEIPDLGAYLESWAARVYAMSPDIQPDDAFYIGRNIGYVVETLMFFGRRDLITPAALQRWKEAMNIAGLGRISRSAPYIAAYNLMGLGELSHENATVLFSPDPAFGTAAPFEAFVGEFTGRFPKEVGQYGPMLNHALLNYALRMRGTARRDALWGAPRRTREQTLRFIRENQLLAGMHIADIQGKGPDEITEMGGRFDSSGVIPEIGASAEGLEAIRIYRERNPRAVIAAGEIEEHNVARAVAAVRAGANILVALENPISAEVVRAVRAEDPDVVIIASARNWEEARRSIEAGVDGIKIRPFAFGPERDRLMRENLELLRRLREAYPGLLIGASRGIQPGELEGLFGKGLEFVGLGVATALEGAAMRKEARSPAAAAVSRLSKELRLLHSWWIRLARGAGLGSQPRAFDAALADGVRDALSQLDAWGAGASAYHRFSRALAELILSRVDPREAPADLGPAVSALLGDLRQERSPYDRATGAAILMDAFAKLGLGSAPLVNGRQDVLREALAAAESVENPYERASAYANVFLAAAQLGLPVGAEHVERALDALDRIPAAWNRGRAAGTLIAALKALGQEDRLFGPDKDHVQAALDAMDAAQESYSGLSPEFFKAFPLLTVLNALSALGRPDRVDRYLSYRADRVEQARSLMARLSPIESAIMSQYYLMALRNLGRLDRAVPDLDRYLRELAATAASLDPAGDWFPNGVALPYVVETLWLFGRQDLVPEQLLRRMVESLPASFSDPRFAVNRDNPASYVLHTLGDLGQAGRMFEPGPGGEAALEAAIAAFSRDARSRERALPSLDHALISLALGMRGASGSEGQAFSSLGFARP